MPGQRAGPPGMPMERGGFCPCRPPALVSPIIRQHGDRTIALMPEDLNIRWLRSFIAVAEQGSGSRAAKAAGISQPTVSLHICKLENAIGRNLFERRDRLQLSEAGEAFLSRACRVVRLHDELFLEVPPVEDGRERRRRNAARLLRRALAELDGRRDAAGD